MSSGVPRVTIPTRRRPQSLPYEIFVRFTLFESVSSSSAFFFFVAAALVAPVLPGVGWLLLCGCAELGVGACEGVVVVDDGAGES